MPRRLMAGLRARPRLRLALIATAGALSTMVVFVASLNAYVLLRAPASTSNLAALPHAQVALVLGAGLNPDGHPSTMLSDRLQRAVALWRSGKVDRVLVSGDHGRPNYDETNLMRNVLLANHVPASAIFTDYAGFNTWASMVRARKIFGVRSAIIVTQKFHMPRALYLADAAGLHATGVDADIHGYGIQAQVSSLRELLARVKAVRDAALDTAVLLGPRIPVTGDGRSSWDHSPVPRVAG